MKSIKLQKIAFWCLLCAAPLAATPLILAFISWYDAKEAESWYPINAVVVSSKVSSECTKFCVHQAHINYQYQINNQDYQGSRLYFGDESQSSKKSAAAIVANYAPQNKIIIYVNPKNAEQSSIYVGKISFRTWTTSLASIMAYIIAWLAYFITVFLIKDLDKK
ncbi:MAG: DUF3592 domain-containing protein [Agitococcus sp.]|nr:DUF3592 domain-containing protein [Agitococcus sp.]